MHNVCMYVCMYVCISDQSGEHSSTKEQLSMKKKKQKLKESAENAKPRPINGQPADSMTLTCFTCNRQFRARIGLVSHQITHLHT